MMYNGKIVEIMAMSECPNNCAHCFIRYKGHISFKQLDQIMNNFSKRYEELILNGTELMMDERYIELCEKYGQNFIYTNGHLINDKNLNMLKRHNINRISVSLHYGIQEIVSEYSLDEISNKIKMAISAGFIVRVLCTISKENYKMLPDIAMYVYKLGAKSLKFINMMKEGRAEGKEFDNSFLGEDELKEFFDILNSTRQNFDKDEFYITRNGAFGNDTLHENNFTCPAGKDWIILTPDYKVYPCNGLLYDDYCIGYWDNEGIFITKDFNHDCKECIVLRNQMNNAKRN